MTNFPSVEELQHQLSRYLENQITLDQFRDWFDDETWGLGAEPESPLRRLAGTVELRIAELTNGHLTEHELRDLLRPLLPEYTSALGESMDFQIRLTRVEQNVEMTSA
jgi:hypothetical protein